MSEITYGRILNSVTIGGVKYTCNGEKAVDGDNTVYMFFKTPGVDNDVILCADITAEEPALTRRVNNNGSYEYSEVFQPVEYGFVSYADAEGTQEYATGKVDTTGATYTFDDVEYTEVVVTENSVPGFVGNHYCIVSTAEPGTIYPLLNTDGSSAEIYVKLI